jgi:hypothetical protein
MMTIKEKALYKIEAKRSYANIQLSSALTHFNRLTMQNDIDEDDLQQAENSVWFYGKELQTYDYILNLIENDRATDESVS